jgi:D-alanyl-D-alanine carboxypeptidase
MGFATQSSTACGSSEGQSMKPDVLEQAIDHYITTTITTEHIPGLSLAVVRGSTPLYVGNWGMANVELEMPASSDTVYCIGSLTKQFTAAAILLLVDQHKLRLDDSIGDYLPGSPETWRAITIRHLLTHTSGIPEYTDLPDLPSFWWRYDYPMIEIIQRVMREPREFAPGDRMVYRNTGYVLLGHLIEEITHRTYAEVLTREIFEPLQMNVTRENAYPTIIPHRASGYTWADETLSNAEYVSPSLVRAAGSLSSSIMDMVRWEAALAEMHVLSAESYTHLWTPARLNDGQMTRFGMGWVIEQDQHLVWHNGGIEGFAAHISRHRSAQTTVIVLCNRDAFGIVDMIGKHVAAMCLTHDTLPAT